jgi:hypothetical protein
MRNQIKWITFAAILLVSCNNGSHCYESTDSMMVTTFSGSKSQKIGSIVVKGYGKNAAGDTLFNNKDSAITKRIGLPLSLTADSTGFVVIVNNIPSIFWVRHKMNIQLISQSCGYAPFYELNAAKYSSLIDSVRLYDPHVNPKSIEIYSANGQNLTVYLRLSAH